jgi:hypothetical protein
MFKKAIVFITMLLFFGPLAIAQNVGYGPHGGRLKTAGKYKIELFGCDDHIEVYLYDVDTNAISNGDITGIATFYYDNAETATTMFIRYGMDGFTAKIPSNSFIYCKPALDIDKKLVVSAKFENECLLSTQKNITSTKK